MRHLHNITISVFSKEGEDSALIEQKLRAFFPFELEKIKLEKQKAKGFKDEVILINSVHLTKQSHLAKFKDWLLDELNDEQKALLLHQLDSRLDKELHFFIRFDKNAWNEEGKLFIVDHGDCYHLKMVVAAYPKKREIAVKILRELFS